MEVFLFLSVAAAGRGGGGDRKDRCRWKKGVTGSAFRQGGDWSMWEPLALLTGHFCSPKCLQLLTVRLCQVERAVLTLKEPVFF